MSSLIRQLLRILRQAAVELKIFNEASREVIRTLLSKITSYILHRHKCHQIHQKMLTLTCYSEWEAHAKLLDQLEGLTEWKLTKESPYYDYERIESRLLLMKQLRKANNVKTLAHCLR